MRMQGQKKLSSRSDVLVKDFQLKAWKRTEQGRDMVMWLKNQVSSKNQVTPYEHVMNRGMGCYQPPDSPRRGGGREFQKSLHILLPWYQPDSGENELGLADNCIIPLSLPWSLFLTYFERSMVSIIEITYGTFSISPFSNETWGAGNTFTWYPTTDWIWHLQSTNYKRGRWENNDQLKTSSSTYKQGFPTT